MEPDGKIIHWARIGVLVGTVLISVVLIAFIYYFIKVWLPAQESRKTELRLQQIEQEMLKTNRL